MQFFYFSFSVCPFEICIWLHPHKIHRRPGNFCASARTLADNATVCARWMGKCSCLCWLRVCVYLRVAKCTFDCARFPRILTRVRVQLQQLVCTHSHTILDASTTPIASTPPINPKPFVCLRVCVRVCSCTANCQSHERKEVACIHYLCSAYVRVFFSRVSV